MDEKDQALLELIASYAGWYDFEPCPVTKFHSWSGLLLAFHPKNSCAWRTPVADYLNGLDEWHRDVWPKLKEDDELAMHWAIQLSKLESPGMFQDFMNASARSRCLALKAAFNVVATRMQEQVDAFSKIVEEGNVSATQERSAAGVEGLV